MSTGAHSRDAGFGLVELLVALAICSLIVLGIGGLLTFVGQLRDRSESTTAVQRALLDLMAVASALSEPSGAGLVSVTPSGFTLHVPPATPLATVTLREGRLEVQYSRTENAISVDLSAFETASLEYLAISSQAADWRATLELPESPRAVRLHLTKRLWRWPLLLWIADRGALP